MKCCVEGCDKEATYKMTQLCRSHYQKNRRPNWKRPEAAVRQSWEDALISVMADKAQKQRCIQAMLQAGQGKGGAC